VSRQDLVIAEVDEGCDNILHLAAVVALHKQLRTVLEVRLTPEDFGFHIDHLDDGIALDYDSATGTVLLRHRQPRSDA
jgi:hypothetical protein